MEQAEAAWRRCSVCKDEIAFGDEYLSCSVTTCNKVGRESVFCSVGCWDAHVPVMNHKDAGYMEHTAPETNEEKAPVRKIVREATAPEKSGDVPKDVLIVVSKLKEYIQKSSGMNTSGDVPPILSELVRGLCDRAVEKARADGRKTVMQRDF